MVLIEDPSRIRVTGVIGEAWKYARGIDLPTGKQVYARGADVSDFKQVILRKLPLNVHVVLMGIWSLEVGFVDRHADRAQLRKVEIIPWPRRREREQLRDFRGTDTTKHRVRQWIIYGCANSERLNSKRRSRQELQGRLRDDGVVIQSVTRPQAEFSTAQNVPCKTNPWTKVILVGLVG